MNTPARGRSASAHLPCHSPTAGPWPRGARRAGEKWFDIDQKSKLTDLERRFEALQSQCPASRVRPLRPAPPDPHCLNTVPHMGPGPRPGHVWPRLWLKLGLNVLQGGASPPLEWTRGLRPQGLSPTSSLSNTATRGWIHEGGLGTPSRAKMAQKLVRKYQKNQHTRWVPPSTEHFVFPGPKGWLHDLLRGWRSLA